MSLWCKIWTAWTCLITVKTGIEIIFFEKNESMIPRILSYHATFDHV
jgi:hypothetical protein